MLGSFFPSAEDETDPISGIFCFLLIYNSRQLTEYTNPVFVIAMYHRQNRLDSNGTWPVCVNKVMSNEWQENSTEWGETDKKWWVAGEEYRVGWNCQEMHLAGLVKRWGTRNWIQSPYSHNCFVYTLLFIQVWSPCFHLVAQSWREGVWSSCNAYKEKFFIDSWCRGQGRSLSDALSLFGFGKRPEIFGYMCDFQLPRTGCASWIYVWYDDYAVFCVV